ncbi:MAG TPA: endonuclease III domain-containing protein [Nitrospirae bacterium]|nr:endonuclease III domain-containing protein [Nitrospirota bacterium]
MKKTPRNKKTNYSRYLKEIYRLLYDEFGPQHWWPGDTPFEVAIGAILTQNTNWGNVEKAINNLKSHKALNATALHRLNSKQIAFLIKPTGYFNVKAKRIGSFLDFLWGRYRGSMKKMEAEDMLSLRPKLLDVHGIGPETADSILLYALEKPVFVIDAYTKRVLQRHNIVSEKAIYHEMQEMFHKNLPTDIKLFNEYHALFVKLGKDFCKTKPKCEGCPLEQLRTIDN